jgi:hypothetical protein
MTSEQEEKLAILKWSLLANLTRVRQGEVKRIGIVPLQSTSIHISPKLEITVSWRMRS